MSYIRALFQEALEKANTQLDNKLLYDWLETVDTEFRSIAYEGASMARALSDFSYGDALVHWPQYRDLSITHAVQVHIGLGWAVGQQQVPLTDIFQKIAPIYQPRVLDGYGYYEGTFRHRSSIRDRKIPDAISASELRGYDQGLGRSLWYACAGNLSKLMSLLESFPDARKPDMWRGIGIAMAYVGGFDEALLASVFQAAAAYRFHLGVGGALLARSRHDAGTLNEYADMACRVWCRLSAEDAVLLSYQTEPVKPISGEAYYDWVSEMGQKISGSLNP